MGIKGQIPWNKGLTNSDPRVRNNTENWKKSMKETRGWERMAQKRKGKPCPNGALAKLGSKNPAWKGGVIKPHRKFYRSAAWRRWRTAVLTRDNNTCQACGKRNIHEAHHIKSLFDYPDLAADVSNGLTLCHRCHMKRHYADLFRGRESTRSGDV